MDYAGPRFKIPAVAWKRTVLCTMCLLAFAACKQAPDQPLVPTTPKPQTRLEKSLEGAVKRAVFEFSIKPNAPYQIDRPANAHHTDIVT